MEAANDAQNVKVDTSQVRKRLCRQNDHVILQSVYCIAKLLHMSEEITSPVYKHMMDSLLLVLINVLIRLILNAKVSRSSAATVMCLRFLEIFNDWFVTQSLFSMQVT